MFVPLPHYDRRRHQPLIFINDDWLLFNAPLEFPANHDLYKWTGNSEYPPSIEPIYQLA